MVDGHRRSVAKSITWRVFSLFLTANVAWIATGSPKTGLVIGAADALIKIGLYYGHERLWNCVGFGRVRPPEYQV
jgi:uncharacterized membrane protein